MDRSQGRKRNVKRNGVWQPPMEKKMTDGRNSPEEEQNTSNSSEEQHLSVSTPMPPGSPPMLPTPPLPPKIRKHLNMFHKSKCDPTLFKFQRKLNQANARYKTQ